jgi:AcrR family transcriptional regulator
MPRVSEAHLVARRQQILDAAQTCFNRNGFHATTMQDVIAEANLSVGAVYRYFKSKADLVEAIAIAHADRIVEQVMPLIDEGQPLFESMRAMVGYIDGLAGADGPFRMALQVWAESLRDERIAETIRTVYSTFRGQFVRIAAQAIKRGHLPADADAEAVGAVLFSLAIGYILQRVLTGSPDTTTYSAGIRTLLTTQPSQ